MIRFVLADGSVVEAVKDCECLPHIHEGPHWLHMSDLNRKQVDRLMAERNAAVCHYGYAQANFLRQIMEQLGIVKIIRGEQ